jgi:acyl-CoA synthetase (AMP-forming)/AMP-acid ligase II
MGLCPFFVSKILKGKIMENQNCVMPLIGMLESVSTFTSNGEEKYSHTIIKKPQDEYESRSKFVVNSVRQLAVPGQEVEIMVQVGGYVQEGFYDDKVTKERKKFKNQKTWFNEVPAK